MPVILSMLTHTLDRLLHRPRMAIGAILMLHRVDTPDAAGIWYNQHLKMSPRTIEEMAAYAREHKCRFVSLDEMTDAIRRKRNVRRLIAVTLDDGYRDNYTNGLSLFRRLNIPYTVYVCTKMVKGEMLYWWDILEHLVLTNGRITLNDGRAFDCASKEAKEQAFLDIREVILRLPQNDLLSHLRELLCNYSVDYLSGNDRLALTWEQIRELRKEPLATIGNHTYSHLAFTGCSDAEIREDIQRAADEMQEYAGVATCHFAYPFGEASAVSRHDMDLVKTLGFVTSVTANEDYVRYDTDLLELPRLFVTERNWKQVLDGIIAQC